MAGGVPPLDAAHYRDIASGLLASLENALDHGTRADVVQAVGNLSTLAHLPVTNTASLPGFNAWHKQFVARFRSSSQTQTITIPEVHSIVHDLQQLY